MTLHIVTNPPEFLINLALYPSQIGLKYFGNTYGGPCLCHDRANHSNLKDFRTLRRYVQYTIIKLYEQCRDS